VGGYEGVYKNMIDRRWNLTEVRWLVPRLDQMTLLYSFQWSAH